MLQRLLAELDAKSKHPAKIWTLQAKSRENAIS